MKIKLEEHWNRGMGEGRRSMIAFVPNPEILFEYALLNPESLERDYRDNFAESILISFSSAYKPMSRNSTNRLAPLVPVSRARHGSNKTFHFVGGFARAKSFLQLPFPFSGTISRALSFEQR